MFILIKGYAYWYIKDTLGNVSKFNQFFEWVSDELDSFDESSISTCPKQEVMIDAKLLQYGEEIDSWRSEGLVGRVKVRTFYRKLGDGCTVVYDLYNGMYR
jgi:hypothetical protein